MDVSALHLELRNAIALSDEIGRDEHAIGDDSLARELRSARATLEDLERRVGRSHGRRIVPEPELIERLEHTFEKLRHRRQDVSTSSRLRFLRLLASIERIVLAELTPTSPVPSKPLFGALPLKRVVPQDVHSALDYIAAAALLSSAYVARSRPARVFGLLAGAALAGVSALTDVRLSAAKKVSLERHEVLDHVVGAGALTVPLLFGYLRGDRVAAAIQMSVGACAVLTALFTDYRAAHGVGSAVRFRRWYGERRVAEVQRPLEGLAGPSVLPPLSEPASSRRR